MQNLTDKQIKTLTAALRLAVKAATRGVRGAGLFDLAMESLEACGVPATAEDLHTFCEKYQADEVTGEVVSRFVAAIQFAEAAKADGL